ncbi:MAG: YHS domain-containing protein [Bacteroidota bacterium]
MAKDPVCGMDVDPACAVGSRTYKGTAYYFCAFGCFQMFLKDPEKYLVHLKMITREQPPGIRKEDATS